MKIVIDMNLSPDWVPFLTQSGHTAVHWSSVGSPRARDRDVLAWARQQEHVVFTHDLDFGSILAATEARGPSVIQVRTQNPTPGHCGEIVLNSLARHAAALLEGALISLDEDRARVRILPLARNMP